MWDREAEGKGEEGHLEMRQSHFLMWLCFLTDEHEVPGGWAVPAEATKELQAPNYTCGHPAEDHNSISSTPMTGEYFCAVHLSLVWMCLWFVSCMLAFCLTSHCWCVYPDLSFGGNCWAGLLHLSLLNSVLFQISSFCLKKPLGNFCYWLLWILVEVNCRVPGEGALERIAYIKSSPWFWLWIIGWTPSSEQRS